MEAFFQALGDILSVVGFSLEYAYSVLGVRHISTDIISFRGGLLILTALAASLFGSLIYQQPQAKEYIAGAFDRLSEGAAADTPESSTRGQFFWTLALLILASFMMGSAVSVLLKRFIERGSEQVQAEAFIIPSVFVGFLVLPPFWRLGVAAWGARGYVIDNLKELRRQQLGSHRNSQEPEPEVVNRQIRRVRRAATWAIAVVGVCPFLAIGTGYLNFVSTPWLAELDPREPGVFDSLWWWASIGAVSVCVLFFTLSARASLRVLRFFGGFGALFLLTAALWGIVYLLYQVNYSDITGGEVIGGRTSQNVFLFAVLVTSVLLWVKYRGWEWSDFARHTPARQSSPPDIKAFLEEDRPRSAKKDLGDLFEESVLDGGYFRKKARVEAQRKRLAEKSEKLTEVAKSIYRNSNEHFGIPNAHKTVNEWIEAREEEISAAIAQPDGRYTCFVASAQGGGVYAAWHAAMVLASLQDRHPCFSDRLFAISGVSGGSLGAQMFCDLVARRAAQKNFGSKDEELTYAEEIRRIFRFDFQTPLITMLLLGDLPRLVFPRWFGSANRATALEKAFDQGWDYFLQPEGSPSSNRNFFDPSDWARSPRTPITVVNATLANSGLPVVLSPFYFSTFYQGIDDINEPESWRHYRFAHFKDLAPHIDISVSTAVSLGARFPYVTPGGRFPTRPELHHRTKTIALADGGYFDNTGTATALSMVAMLKKRLREKFGDRAQNVHVELIRLLGPDDSGLAAMTRSPGELRLPLETLYRARIFRRDFFHRLMDQQALTAHTVRFDNDEHGAPLSWQLSRRTRRLIYDNILQGFEPDEQNPLWKVSERLAGR